MRLSQAATQLLAAYPRIYFACHRQHVHDPESGARLSAKQASILDHLDTVAATTLTDLATHMGVTAGTMSVAVDRLVAAGYVKRAWDDRDGRRVQLRLTDAGDRIRTANSVLDPSRVEALLAQLPAPDLERALAGLALLARAADTLGAAPATHRRRRRSA
jgi:MarR family transcriptional regulator, organic hydroperoxide resistance regulator